MFDLVEKCTSANDALPITSQVHTCSNSCGIHVVRLLCFRTGNTLFQKLDIIKTCPCNVHPLTPHFYIIKLGLTGVFIIL